MLEEPKELKEMGDGWKQISIMCSESQYRKMLGVVKKYCQKYGWEYQSHKIDEDVFEIIVSQWDESTLTDDFRESTKKFGKKFAKEGTESNPRFKCMEGRNEYVDDIREFRDDVVSALKKCYGDEFIVESDMMNEKSIVVSDPYSGLDYKIDISVSDEVEM